MADAPPDPSFEEARAELERIVAELETGQADLERAVELWERGEALHRICLQRLDAAEGRIEELAKRIGAPPAAGAPGGGDADDGATVAR